MASPNKSQQPNGTETDYGSHKSPLEILADATVVLALVTGLLFFLGVQKQKTFMQVLGYTQPLLFQPTETTLITGFDVLLSVGDPEGNNVKTARYVWRGIIMAILFLLAYHCDALKSRRNLPWAAMLAIVLLWAVSWEAQRQGAEEARRKQSRDLATSTIYYVWNDEMAAIAGRLTVTTDRMVILTAGGGTATYIPIENVRRIGVTLSEDPKRGSSARQPTSFRTRLLWALIGFVCTLSGVVALIWAARKLHGWISKHGLTLGRRGSRSRA